MGRIAVDILIDEIEAGERNRPPKRVILEPELVVRRSSCRDAGANDADEDRGRDAVSGRTGRF
jgi:hypothetical protein